MFGEKLYDSSFHIRGIGKGPYAEQVTNMFKIACRQTEINKEPLNLTTSHFRNPNIVQLDLFE